MGLDSRDYYKPSGFGGFSYFPPVLKNILLANGVVFLIQLVSKMLIYTSQSGEVATYEYFLNKFFALNPIGSKSFYIWQLVTYQFMHGDFMHIFWNMLMLWMFGMEIANILGPRKFLFYYLLCGVGGGLLQLILSPLFGGMGTTIGASAAVFGVMIAFGMYFPDRYVFIYFLIPIKAKYLIAILVVFEFMSVNDPTLIAHLAHIGGALTGFIYILIDRKNEFRPDNVFGRFKRSSSNPFASGRIKKPFGGSFKERDIQDADYYDINNPKKDEEINQAVIDAILDKISQSGYQNLSEREKRILFEASKKK